MMFDDLLVTNGSLNDFIGMLLYIIKISANFENLQSRRNYFHRNFKKFFPEFF